MAYFGPKVKREIESEDREAWKKVMEFYQNEFLCDIKLIVGHESRSAHRIVLSSLCPKGPWSNEKATRPSDLENEPLQLDVSEVFKTPETFAAIIDYIYLGTIRLRTETLLQILEVANQLHLTDLIIHCSQFLLEHVRIGNVLSIWNLAYEMELRQLAEVCRVLTRELFRDVLIIGNDMKLLSTSFMEMLLDQKYIIHTVKPTEIVRFILKWLTEDLEKRLQTARILVSKVGICQPEMCNICDSVCDNELKSRNLQKSLHGCCISSLYKKCLPDTLPTRNDVQSHSDVGQNATSKSESIQLHCSPSIPDMDGGWMLMVRDSYSTTVYCRKSKVWLELPNITYPYIVCLSHRKYLACTKQLFTRCFQFINLNLIHQPDSIEERRLINDTNPDPKYIWYLGYKKKWYLVSLLTAINEYRLILLELDGINSGYVNRCNLKTSMPVDCTIKGFTYFNTNTFTIIIIIACPSNVTYQNVKSGDTLNVFQITWDKRPLIKEIVTGRLYHRCSSLSTDQFMYQNSRLYLFEQDLVKNLVHAIEYNIAITIPVIDIDIRSINGCTYTSIQLPKPGLNILPLKPKADQSRKVPTTQCPHALNSQSYSVSSGSAKCESFSVVNQSCVYVIDDKLFLVTHRAPGIVQAYIIDIFQKSWEFTPPLPLAALKDIKVNTFYSDCSLHEGFAVGKKHFESEDFSIFEKWCLQQWQGMGETLENDSNF